MATTVTIPGSLLTSCPGAMGPGTTTNASGAAPAPHRIKMAAALHRSRTASVETVVAADVDPLQSIWRPRPAPAAVVGGEGVGRAKEREATEVVMAPAEGREPGRESGMRKLRTGEVGAAEMRGAHAAEVHAATTMHATTAAVAAAGERRRRQRNCRGQRPRDEATQEPVVHPNPSWFNRSDACHRKKQTGSRPKSSEDFK